MPIKWLWICVIAFSVLEWVSIPFLAAFTEKLHQVINGILIIAFIIYPLLFVISLLLLKKGDRRVGAVILLIPLIVYMPVLLTLQTLLR